MADTITSRGEFRDIRIRYNIEKEFTPFPANYNVTPGQDVPVVVHQNGANQRSTIRTTPFSYLTRSVWTERQRFLA
jgi:hypothetical protein